MSNVLIEKDKLDVLATAIANKSGEPLKLTLAEMVEAVDGIDMGITPTGNIDITGAGVTDVTNYATATVPQGEINVSADTGFYTQNNVYRWHFRPFANIKTSDYAGKVGFLADNYYKAGNNQIFSAIASGTSVTPTETAQSIGGAEYMMAGAVTVNAIPSSYVGTGITRRSSSDLTTVGSTVTAPAGYYESDASTTVAGGVTVTDEANATGITCVITSGSSPTPPSPDIPLNTQLIDYTAVTTGYIVDGDTGEETVSQWSSCSDYTLIDPTMTFSYVGYQWYDIVFFTESKQYISKIYMDSDKDSVVNDYAHGTLTPAKIPPTAKYVRINTYPNAGIGSTQLSLIRTS